MNETEGSYSPKIPLGVIGSDEKIGEWILGVS